MQAGFVIKPLRILLVEDNAHLRELTGELLAGEDREVVTCGSAEEALRHFTAAPFHAVITDVSLPAMSGIELAKKLLTLAPQLCVVVCSGYKFDFAVDKLGANVRALPKPFDTEQIDAILNQIPR